MSKSLQVFNSLSDLEKNQFRLFIQNTSTNSEKLLKLAKFYNYQLPSKSGVKLNKSDLFSKVFGKMPYSDVKLRLLQSEFLKLLEDYIIWMSVKKSKSKYLKQLLEYFHDRNMPNLYAKELKKFNTNLRNEDEVSIDASHQIMENALINYDYQISNRKSAYEEGQSAITEIDRHYIRLKLKNACQISTQESIYNHQFDQGMLDITLGYISKNALWNDALIGVYYYCLLMIRNGSIEDYETFSEILENKNQVLSDDEKSQLYSLAINYCIRALNSGDLAFGKKGIELYIKSIDNGTLLSKGKISKFTFRNIVTMAIRIGDRELAESFIIRYGDLLDNKDKTNMILFANSLVLFSKKEYELASDAIQNIQFKDFLFNLATKSLLIKIYYEKGELLLLESHLDAFYIFLKRHKNLGYHKQNYLNIISLTRKLINAKSDNKISKLEHLIRSEPNLTERRWLLEKIEERKV